mmetsp:Transcript_31917/g.51704  ORF Transcript_31917/g.51704 Transcript_31917/m.51704 type:complete len:208 (+) Transcript_31917:3-626(+)
MQTTYRCAPADGENDHQSSDNAKNDDDLIQVPQILRAVANRGLLWYMSKREYELLSIDVLARFEPASAPSLRPRLRGVGDGIEVPLRHQLADAYPRLRGWGQCRQADVGFVGVPWVDQLVVIDQGPETDFEVKGVLRGGALERGGEHRLRSCEGSAVEIAFPGTVDVSDRRAKNLIRNALHRKSRIPVSRGVAHQDGPRGDVNRGPR